MDRIINFQLALFGILVFRRIFCLIFSFKFLLHGALHSAVPELQPWTEVFHNANLNCMEEHTNFQLCPCAAYAKIYEAGANISEHRSLEDVTL